MLKSPSSLHAMLEKLEDSLSCLICKELLDVPEMGACEHAFCSICIRRHLTHEQKCPVCRQDLHAGGLKRVRVLENVIQEYRKVRKQIMDLQQQRQQPPASQNLSQCPICLEMLPIEEIQGRHIESCLKPRRKQEPPKRKAVPNYTLIKDKELRGMLVKDGLSTEGNRSKLTARHREWLLQWNANASRNEPLPAAELRKNMKTWELAQAQVAASPKKLDVGNWAADNSEAYSELCELAFNQLGRKGPRKRTLEEIEADS